MIKNVLVQFYVMSYMPVTIRSNCPSASGAVSNWDVPEIADKCKLERRNLHSVTPPIKSYPLFFQDGILSYRAAEEVCSVRDRKHDDRLG